jgi:ABC-2 type transport system ATP-binding protein
MKDVTKSFPQRRGWNEMLLRPLSGERVTVLNRVSLQVREGEFFGLLGQNGAGKTTLFRVLSTLVLPESGSVTIDGADALKAGAHVRRVLSPVIASERSLYWRLDARENLRLYAAFQRIPRAEIAGETERVLRAVSLLDTGVKLVGSFSAGMRQRLLIARALLGRPRILLLDEPTRSLDPISARDFRRFLRETIVGEQGCTVILATHDADDVWNLCDRVAVLERGTLLAVDRTAALRHRLGDEVYRVWIPDEQAQLLDGLATRSGIPLLGMQAAAEAGWREAALEIVGGSERAAEFVRAAAAEGLALARFEKSVPDLAELIERVVRKSGALE